MRETLSEITEFIKRPIARRCESRCIRASLEKSESPTKLFLSASISRNEHFPASVEWRRSFSIEKSKRFPRDAALSREFVSRGPLLRARCVFAHFFASEANARARFGMNKISHYVLHRSVVHLPGDALMQVLTQAVTIRTVR